MLSLLVITRLIRILQSTIVYSISLLVLTILKQLHHPVRHLIHLHSIVNNQPISFPAMNMNQLIVYQQNMRLQAQVGDTVLHLQDKKQEDIDVGSP